MNKEHVSVSKSKLNKVSDLNLGSKYTVYILILIVNLVGFRITMEIGLGMCEGLSRLD